MTVEEAIEYGKDQLEIFGGKHAEFIKIVIHTLEMQKLKEPILDKIKTEIEQSYCTPNNDYDHGRNYGLYMATQIIDKYKAENEDDEQILEYTDQNTMMSAT